MNKFEKLPLSKFHGTVKFCSSMLSYESLLLGSLLLICHHLAYDVLNLCDHL